jgi:hypothetical protein
MRRSMMLSKTKNTSAPGMIMGLTMGAAIGAAAMFVAIWFGGPIGVRDRVIVQHENDLLRVSAELEKCTAARPK